MFRVRIVSVDHYMSPPIPELDVTYSDFRKSSIKQVPVIRIFGSTPTGEKSCVHVHGVFPYICVPYDGSEPHLNLSYKLAASLDKAINIASGYSTSNTQHVYKVVLVAGIPFYGYHRKRHQFLKIYFYKPSVIKQAVSLLQNGAILNKIFQPHEAHISYILQFFIDFNLYGMSFIDFDQVKYRRTKYSELLSEIPPELILPESVPAVSLSQFEVDSSSLHISNRPSSQGNEIISNPGITAIWEDENRRRAMTDGSPLQIPQLHSQRPDQKQTSSELFYLRRIEAILNNPSQSGDDSSLSGEPMPLTNKSYAIEEPPNNPALDASFVSLHVPESFSHAHNSLEPGYLEDTIVDEDLALNASMSQRLSQTLDRSLALDYEDLELLDALETLADTRSATVDNDSVLGSQTARGKSVPCSATGDDEEVSSEGEDDKWGDKTLIEEEDEVAKLLDLTMPEIDENALLNNYHMTENLPGPSHARDGDDDFKIPQVDGASDFLGKADDTTCFSKKNMRIPQIDGVNDIPDKKTRKSLGMRGGMNRLDSRYNSKTGDLIFKKKKVTDESSVAPAIQEPTTVVNPSSSAGLFRSMEIPSSVKQLSFTSTVPHASVECSSPDKLPLNLCHLNAASHPTNFVQSNLAAFCEETVSESICPTQSTIQNTLDESALICLLPSSQLDLPLEAPSTSRKVLLSYYSEDDIVQDAETVRNLQPPVACCSSAAVDCDHNDVENYESDHDCADAFINLLAKKDEEPVLRGDPSLYPESPPEQESSFTELLTATVSKSTNEVSMSVDLTKSVDNSAPHTVTQQLRRSTRLISENIPEESKVTVKASKSVDSGSPMSLVDEFEMPPRSFSPSSPDEMECTEIPGFTTTMYDAIRVSLDNNWVSANNESSASDSEMCRLSGALENGQMEEILQTGTEETCAPPTSSRREELMHFLDMEKKRQLQESLMATQESLSERRRDSSDLSVDPITDAMLLRKGVQPLAGPRPGKNMALVKRYCSKPLPSRRRPTVLPSEIRNHREVRKQKRQERHLKLSITAQRRKKQSSSMDAEVRSCYVSLEKLTKEYLHSVCLKDGITLKGTALTALGLAKEIKKSHSSSKRSGGNKALANLSTPNNSSVSLDISSSGNASKSSIQSSARSRQSSYSPSIRKSLPVADQDGSVKKAKRSKSPSGSSKVLSARIKSSQKPPQEPVSESNVTKGSPKKGRGRPKKKIIMLDLTDCTPPEISVLSGARSAPTQESTVTGEPSANLPLSKEKGLVMDSAISDIKNKNGFLPIVKGIQSAFNESSRESISGNIVTNGSPTFKKSRSRSKKKTHQLDATPCTSQETSVVSETKSALVQESSMTVEPNSNPSLSKEVDIVMDSHMKEKKGFLPCVEDVQSATKESSREPVSENIVTKGLPKLQKSRSRSKKKMHPSDVASCSSAETSVLSLTKSSTIQELSVAVEPNSNLSLSKEVDIVMDSLMKKKEDFLPCVEDVQSASKESSREPVSENIVTKGLPKLKKSRSRSKKKTHQLDATPCTSLETSVVSETKSSTIQELSVAVEPNSNLSLSKEVDIVMDSLMKKKEDFLPCVEDVQSASKESSREPVSENIVTKGLPKLKKSRSRSKKKTHQLDATPCTSQETEPNSNPSLSKEVDIVIDSHMKEKEDFLPSVEDVQSASNEPSRESMSENIVTEGSSKLQKSRHRSKKKMHPSDVASCSSAETSVVSVTKSFITEEPIVSVEPNSNPPSCIEMDHAMDCATPDMREKEDFLSIVEVGSSNDFSQAEYPSSTKEDFIEDSDKPGSRSSVTHPVKSCSPVKQKTTSMKGRETGSERTNVEAKIEKEANLKKKVRSTTQDPNLVLQPDNSKGSLIVKPSSENKEVTHSKDVNSSKPVIGSENVSVVRSHGTKKEQTLPVQGGGTSSGSSQHKSSNVKPQSGKSDGNKNAHQDSDPSLKKSVCSKEDSQKRTSSKEENKKTTLTRPVLSSLSKRDNFSGPETDTPKSLLVQGAEFTKSLKHYKIPKKSSCYKSDDDIKLKSNATLSPQSRISSPPVETRPLNKNSLNKKDENSQENKEDSSDFLLELEVSSEDEFLSGPEQYTEDISKSDSTRKSHSEVSFKDENSHGCDQRASVSNPDLKRKFPEEHCQETSKWGRKDGPSQEVQKNRGREIPKAVAHWFAKPYLPWTMWSPNTSPTHHHAHLFSPPRPVSPDNPYDVNRGGFAAAGHGRMDDEEEERSVLNKGLSPISCSSLNLYVLSQDVDNISNSIQDHPNQFIKISRKESMFGIGGSSSRKTSQEHSILDSLSEKSFESSENFCDKETSPNLPLSISPIKFHHSKTEQTKQQEDASSTLFQSSCSASEEKIESASHGENDDSSESSDMPCGQDVVKERSEEKHLRNNIHSCAFKTYYKPPSRKEVIDSLSSLNIHQVINIEPFYRNYLDVKGKVEVGGNVLNLTSRNCRHLEEFQSSIAELNGLGHQQKQLFERFWGLSQIKGDVNQLISNQSEDRMMCITPVIKPPTVRSVALWVKARHLMHHKGIFVCDQKINSNQCVKEGEEQTSRTDIYQCISQEVDQKAESCSSLNLSFESVVSKSVQMEKVLQASTPHGPTKQSGEDEVSSPLLTPIPQSKSEIQPTMKRSKARKGLKKHMSYQSPLPSVSEQDEHDIGVKVLEAEVTTTIPPSSLSNNDHDNSSLRRLLLDTQFCQDAASPSFRHVSDASACQIKGISASPGFKMVLENLQSAKTLKEYQYITIMTVEVHICTCGTLNPDPERDPIGAVFYSVSNDVPDNFKIPTELNGIIAVDGSTSTSRLLNRCGIEGSVEYACDEKTLLKILIDTVHKWDPDILAGFEIEMLSWGYVLQRACALGVNLIQELSRIPNQKEGKHADDFEDNNGLSGLKITGRIVLDVWRLFRSELALQSYTFENLMYHVLHQRVSRHSFKTLSQWWENPSQLYRWMTVRYYQQRVQGVHRLLDQLDIIGRTSELARLFGIQFFEVLSRGSQFRVESMMLRLAKPMNYIPVSPSVQQRAHMRAPECLPLIMEPESRFYCDPLIVLDFQSLYPSMIIAYNYCFSTCLGRVEHLGKSSHFEFGCTELRVSNSHLQHLKDNISVSPSGVAFVKKSVRQGILPRMLEEILEARLAVKQSMKHHKDDHTLQRVLHARQLGLKLIANVTYGYTSANFSGRMPCIEIGDSVVSKGRETLERAIALVHNNSKWQARVVYGDTDSLFVLVPGRTRADAFKIGSEIASAVTQDNPSPVKLKLEKVYQPSILQTKKRYVGFMYESPDQLKPIYEAKGIETVRRDGCPAVAKMLEKSLRILFETSDVSAVKKYVTHQFSKILGGRANIQDLIYAKEYRGKDNYRPGACVPALELAKRWLRTDRRAEPRIGERVPYVIVNGPPGSALIHLVRHPNELLCDPTLRYNGVYYVTRAIIPPLARCFSLLGADVSSWYADLPRKIHTSLPSAAQTGFKKTISQYFTTMECACCGIITHGGVCAKCRSNPQLLATSLSSKLHSWESTHLSITKICQTCLGRSQPLDCCSLDCPITYRRHQSSQRQEQSAFVSQLLDDFFLTTMS